MKLKNWLLIALIGLLGVTIYQGHRNSLKSQEIALYEHNDKVSRDSIHHLQLQNGQLLAERQAYVLSEKRMAEELDLSKKEVADLRRKLRSSINLISKLRTNVHVDTLYIPGQTIYEYPDSICADFKYKDRWLDMAGQVKYDYSGTGLTLYNMGIDLPLTIGLTESKQVFATTPNPYVKITNIHSVISDQTVRKVKHWSFGLNVGPGLYYDAIDKQVTVGAGIQFGISYNF